MEDSSTVPTIHRTIPFRFTGQGSEYFRIWITNLALTIVTLGIYSAWAKVRRNRYFYGNTRLGDEAFEYLADPRTILKGRLIAFGVFGAYSLITNVVPVLSLVFSAGFAFLLPWLVVRAAMFRARNTAFRNIRFGFHGKYGEAAAVHVGLPILLVPTLGIVYPEYVRRQKLFLINNSSYGTATFRLHTGARPFYEVFVAALLIAVAGVILAAALYAVLAPAGYAAAGVLYLGLMAYVGARTGNIVYNNAMIEGHRFRSRLDFKELFGLYLMNALGIVATAGLYVPWARVRLARYRAERLEFIPEGDLDGIVAKAIAGVASTGEEMGEMFNVDIGL